MFASSFFVYKFKFPPSKRFTFPVLKLARQTTVGHQPVPTFAYDPNRPTWAATWRPSFTDTEQTPFSDLPEFVPFQPITFQPSIRPSPFRPNEGKQIDLFICLSHHNLVQNFNLEMVSETELRLFLIHELQLWPTIRCNEMASNSMPLSPIMNKPENLKT